MTRSGDKQSEKKKLTLIDWFLIIGAILLLAAVVGQDIAVYAINKTEKSDRFEVFFTIRTVEAENAKQLTENRLSSSQLIVSSDGVELGKINGGLESGTAVNDHLYTVSGSMIVYGKITDGICYPYGYEKALRVADKLYTLFEDVDGTIPAHGYTIEILQIKLLEN